MSETVQNADSAMVDQQIQTKLAELAELISIQQYGSGGSCLLCAQHKASGRFCLTLANCLVRTSRATCGLQIHTPASPAGPASMGANKPFTTFTEIFTLFTNIVLIIT